MANREVVALNESTPQLEAAQSGDTYLFPRAQINEGKITFQGASADTAAADIAAMGYTAVEGLILTGQGSTGDVTIKNDADARVFYVPTGTQNVTFDGVITATSAELTTPVLGTVTSGVISACTSSGMVMVAPVLGTPASGVLTNMTGTSVELAAMIAGNTTAVTATVGGGTTGLIPATAEHVTVTSDTATKQISLPAAVAGKRIRITQSGAENVELISVVAGDKVNNVTVGATNEALLVKTSLYTLEYDGTDNWVMQGLTNLGAVETPVVPDAL